MNKIIKTIFIIFLSVVFATSIDYITHHSFLEFEVPFSYFPNKIMFGTFWSVIVFYFLKDYVKGHLKMSAFVSLIVAILLQTRYYFEGYDLYFVTIFLFLHYLMFQLSFYLLFRYFKVDMELN